MLIEQIASDAVLDEAYAWLCHRRRDYPANADIWPFRRNWNVEKRRVQDNLLTNSYRFEPPNADAAMPVRQVAQHRPSDRWAKPLKSQLVLR